MINQPKEQNMKDLDMSHVEDDARDQTISDLTGDLDPVDLYGVCSMICDAFFAGDAEEFMKSSICTDLIQASQSNPNGVHEKIADALEIDFG